MLHFLIMEERNKAKAVTVSLYPAQIRELEKLAELTGQTKSDLVQQAVNVLIAQFKETLERREATETATVD
jgi:predicted transcriptional regulator